MTERDTEATDGHQAALAERIAWLERAIVDHLGRVGPQGLVDLRRAIPFTQALARLARAGIVAKTPGTAATAGQRNPTYYLVKPGEASPAPAQASPKVPTQPEAASPAPGQAQAPSVTAPTAKPRRRGGPKGFVLGSWNYQRALDILELLADQGAFTQDDLRHWLGGRWEWLNRPLARLKEEAKIIEQTVTIKDRARRPVEIVVYHLPGQDPVPVYARFEDPFDAVIAAANRLTNAQVRGPETSEVTGAAEATAVDDPVCPGCEQAGPGRGACGKCAGRSGGRP